MVGSRPGVESWKEPLAGLVLFDGSQDLDQPPATIGDRSNIVPLNENGIAYRRTPNHVLNIVYENPASGIVSGGFFPEGLNGKIRST